MGIDTDTAAQIITGTAGAITVCAGVRKWIMDKQQAALAAHDQQRDMQNIVAAHSSTLAEHHGRISTLEKSPVLK